MAASRKKVREGAKRQEAHTGRKQNQVKKADFKTGPIANSQSGLGENNPG